MGMLLVGFIAFPVIAIAANAGWIEGKRFLGRRRKQAAEPILSILNGKIERGQRISARPLLATEAVKGRSYALVLFKQGPAEPQAEATVITEPLDDA